MRDLFEDVLLLVPVALVLFLRVFAGRRKAEKAKDASTRPTAAQRAPAKRPAAASALARLYEKLTGTAPASAGPLEPLHFEEGPTPLGNLKPARREPAVVARTSAPSPAKAPKPAAKAPKHPETRAPAAAFAFPAALERLPPLQRAVALTEILGAPRSSR